MLVPLVDEPVTAIAPTGTACTGSGAGGTIAAATTGSTTAGTTPGTNPPPPVTTTSEACATQVTNVVPGSTVNITGSEVFNACDAAVPVEQLDASNSIKPAGSSTEAVNA